jgi:urease accessory protein
MMLTDARLPTGGHTQSSGLEAAVRAGLGSDGADVTEVAAYARDRLRTVMRVEAGTAVVARRLTCAGSDPRAAEPAWAARTPSPALRAVSRRQGRALLRLAGRVWPAALDHLPADTEVPRPVVVGVVGAVTGLSAEQVARVVGYDDAQTVVAAALKLLPVDPVEAASWVAGLHAELEELVTATASAERPDEIPADGAPLVDVLAQQHSTQRMRLFHA